MNSLLRHTFLRHCSYMAFCYSPDDGSGAGSAAGGGSPGSSTGGSGSPAPSSPPAGEGSVGSGSGAGVDSPSPSSDVFAGFEDDLDSIDLNTDVVPGTVPEATPVPAPAPAPVVQPAATPAPGAPPAAQPAQAPQAPPGGAAAPRSKVEGFIQEMNDQSIGALADWSSANIFKLSDEEAAALDTDAMSVIPKLMGRVYAQALKSAASLIHNFTPEMIQAGIQKHTSTSTKAAEANNAFYQAHPELNPKDHQAVMERWAKAFRAQNPTATRQQAIDFVGRAVKVELGIQSQQAPATRAAPFVPARPGGRPQNAPQEGTPWDGLDFDMDSGE